jgi:hypothetical protein
MSYVVYVVFNRQGKWSLPYSYLSDTEYTKNTVVLVPTSNFYNLGVVVKCEDSRNVSLKDGIEYKSIIRPVSKAYLHNEE